MVTAWFGFNLASKKTHEKMGFKAVARSRKWVDMEIYGLSNPLICAVWQGGWVVGMEESIFAELEALDEDEQ